jgi:hypothetical protein
MTDAQILTVALASVPTMLTVLIGILVNNPRLTDLRSHGDAGFRAADNRFDEIKRNVAL